MLDRREAARLCRQVLGRCGDYPGEVLLLAAENALTRFANNAIHQNVAERNLSLQVRLLLGKRSGMATTNRSDENSLDQVVERALANARAGPENPDDPGLGAPSEYAPVEAFDQATAAYSPGQRATEVGLVCRLASENGLTASGAFFTGTQEMAVASTLGLFSYHAGTRADFQTVVMGEDSSGWSHATSWRAKDLMVEDLGREALGKAARGREPRQIAPGEYAVVFDPYVTHDLLQMLDYNGMGAQSVLDGRSWMNDRLGQKAMSALVSIRDDGLDPSGLPMPFDFEGMPKQPVDIVAQGVVGEPVYDRSTAHKAQTPNTGHAVPPKLRPYGYGPLALNLFMAPGDASVDEMIGATERGLYITRFWYTRLVHPRDCLVTGMTRDGVFMIEKGELAYPVKNLRFTQSYVHALAEVEAVSRETRLMYEDFGGSTNRVPALKIAKFNFTGTTV